MLDDLYSGLAMPYEHDPRNWSVLEVKEELSHCHVRKVGRQENFDEQGKGGGWQAVLPHKIWQYPDSMVSSRPLRDNERW